MKLLGIAALGLLFACGPSSGGGDDDTIPTPSAEDADGDGIADVDEGRAANVDTDGDGTPDYLDDDSDDDGIPDYREAGDTRADTKPVDSDTDGTPDFRDLDSDSNERSDTLDGVDDTDADGIPDFADIDDDGDQIADIYELGPTPEQPLDSEHDGVPDFRDPDSDNDTVLDLYEGMLDFDSDGAPNFLDDDSDGDCIKDHLEARGNPPADTDGDRRYDFLDRDSDGDGLLDRAEDVDCNGARDGNESSAIDDDTDNDGVSDMIESAAGTNPNNPASNPQANGDFVFIEPYEQPQTPADSNLDFKSQLQAVDMYVLLDRSGSMRAEIDNVRDNLATVVRNLTCAPAGTGVPPNCIPDLWAGAGTLGYIDSQADAYRNHVDIQPAPSFSSVVTTTPPGLSSEVTTFAAWSSITGLGGSQFSLPAVPARASCAGSPAAVAGIPTFGYPCFRQTALPVVLLATDEAPLTGANTTHVPDWATIVLPQFTARRARLLGILGEVTGDELTKTRNDLRAMATATGAVDAANGNAPLVFDGAGANAAAAIQQGVLTLARGLPLDINATSVDDPSDSVNAVTAFIDHVQTLQLGTAQCANGLTDVDTNDPDSFPDKYVQVRTGTPVCWKLFSKKNTTVPATQEPQLFRASVRVFGDGVTELDRRDVFFLVPPVPADDPIE